MTLTSQRRPQRGVAAARPARALLTGARIVARAPPVPRLPYRPCAGIQTVPASTAPLAAAAAAVNSRHRLQMADLIAQRGPDPHQPDVHLREIGPGCVVRRDQHRSSRSVNEHSIALRCRPQQVLTPDQQGASKSELCVHRFDLTEPVK